MQVFQISCMYCNNYRSSNVFIYHHAAKLGIFFREKASILGEAALTGTLETSFPAPNLLPIPPSLNSAQRNVQAQPPLRATTGSQYCWVYLAVLCTYFALLQSSKYMKVLQHEISAPISWFNKAGAQKVMTWLEGWKRKPDVRAAAWTLKFPFSHFSVEWVRMV